MQTSAIASERRRQSVILTEAEKLAFKQWVDNQPTIIDAAEILNVQRQTIMRVIAFGSGSPETIEKIRAVALS